MPEGHTIHRLARRHQKMLAGHVVAASSPQGRFAEGAALIDGTELRRTDAWGKHLFHDYGDHVLHVHLGLYGKFRDGTGEPPEPVGALRLRLVSDEHWLDLRGPTACELLSRDEVAARTARLGPDPLRRGADVEKFLDRVGRSRAPAGVLLMDQSVLAGVGNVYRAEVLFRAGLSPTTPGRDVPRAVWQAIWEDLVVLLRAGVRAGRIVTTEPEDRERPAGRPRRGDAHYVYGRAGLPCRRCGRPCSPTSWRRATCSGARSARPEGPRGPGAGGQEGPRTHALTTVGRGPPPPPTVDRVTTASGGRHLRPRRALAVVVVVLAGLLLAPLSPAHAGSRPSLSFVVRGGGTAYVAGQGLLLVGDLGVRGVHPISVESNLNRPGDRWLPLVGLPYRGRTRPDGTFELPIRAPGMFGISYRVVGAGHATPGLTFDARTQDVDLWVEGSQDYTRPVQPTSLLPFAIVADTTPDFYRRPTTQGLPVLAGRGLTLLRRSSPGDWDVVARTTVDQDGRGRFGGLTEPPGDHVYRVRAERWTRDGSDVGWIWSWPIDVHVLGLLELPTYQPEGGRTPGNVAGQRGPERAHANAASTHGWGAVRWDYAWTAGESLDDPPSRGTDRRGRWTETGTGLGRVVRHNGGLLVSSGKPVRDGRGDVGSTWAVLSGAAAPYGRWELPLSLAVGETRSSDYDVVAELVPTSGADRPCADTVTIARWSGLGTRMTIGAARGPHTWSRTLDTEGVGHDIPIVGVEVAPDHVTWFLDGRPIGSVRSRKVAPGGPLALRLGLEGDQSEHDSSELASDWQRSYALAPGRQVTRAPALGTSARTGC